MTDSTEPRAEGLNPCPNQECRNSAVHFIATGVSSVDEGYISCPFCGMSGPMADTEAESGRLWNALPRPTTDTVERAAVEKTVTEYLVRAGAVERNPGPHGQFGAEQAGTVKRTLDHLLAEIRALPSAAGGEDKLREAWREVEKAVDEWSEGIPDDEEALELIREIVLRERRASLQQEPTK